MKRMEVICYLCNKSAKDWRQNLNETKSKHSGTSVKDFIQKFLKDFVSPRNLDDESNCICSFCLSQIHAYDWTCLKAIKQEKEFRFILMATERSHIKQNQMKTECGIGNKESFVSNACSMNGIETDLKPSVIKVEQPEPIKATEPVKRSKPIVVRVVKRVPFLNPKPSTTTQANPTTSTAKSIDGSARDTIPRKTRIPKNKPPSTDSQKPSKQQLPKSKSTRPTRSNTSGIVSFLCDLCGQTFSCNRNLRRHQDGHLDIRNEKCLQCPKSFREKRTLEEHTRIVHGGVVAPFTCKYCDKRFTRRENFQNHEKRHREDTKKHKCQFCPAAFELKHDFKLHLKRKHDAVVPHIDPPCSSIASN